MRMRKWLFAALVLLVAGGASWWFFFRTTVEPPKILATATIGRGEVRKVLEATGIIKAQVGAIVRIGARATGRIDRMLVKVGDKVKREQLIAVIDSRELVAQKAEAEARVVQSRAELERVRSVFPLQIKEAEAELSLASAQATYQSTNRDRQKQLWDRQLIAKDALDDATQRADVARNQVVARQAALARTKAEFARQQERAESALLEAEASLNSITVRLSYTSIFSPLDGIVSQVTSQEGETVVAGLQVANLITVLDPARLEMWIYVDETDVGQTERGMPVEFRVEAFPGKTFKGEIDQIYPQPEIRDNIVYYQALVKLDAQEAELLRPEMTTQAQIVVAAKKDALTLPNEAIKWVGDRQQVFKKVGDEKFEPVMPKLGLRGLATSEIVEGLAEGDVVATQVVLPGRTAASSQGGQGGQRQTSGGPPPGGLGGSQSGPSRGPRAPGAGS